MIGFIESLVIELALLINNFYYKRSNSLTMYFFFMDQWVKVLQIKFSPVKLNIKRSSVSWTHFTMQLKLENVWYNSNHVIFNIFCSPLNSNWFSGWKWKDCRWWMIIWNVPVSTWACSRLAVVPEVPVETQAGRVLDANIQRVNTRR